MGSILFDIQRSSTVDGPGIRTTVFLKGCPLKCVWCHNPEAISRKVQLSFNESKCISCGKCAEVCDHQAHSFVDGNHFVDFDSCKTDGACVEVCEHEALELIGYDSDINAVMEIVNKDKIFYEASGGGLTISGGEPMMDYAFTKDLLKRAKEEGIHTCLDTSGQAPTNRYLEIMPYVDLFLYDYKCTDSLLHKDLTRVDNKLILENLKSLYKHGASILLRCPNNTWL